MMHLLTGFPAVLTRFTRDFSGHTPCLFSLKLVLYGKTWWRFSPLSFILLPGFHRFRRRGQGGMGRGGGVGVWACNRKFTVSYRKRKLSSCFRGTKGLHKRCMNIKQNYILASHASTLADMFVWNLFQQTSKCIKDGNKLEALNLVPRAFPLKTWVGWKVS